jgi:hypothetical protein
VSNVAARSKARQAVTSPRRIAIVTGALALMGMSDVEPENPMPCSAAAASVRVYAGSRLLEAPGERLELARGRALGCDSSRVRRVLAELEGAFFSGLERRLPEPLGVHLDPLLPARHAPLAGIEVHVTSRELLVATSALDALGRESWRHELLHAMASAPPPLGAAARRLWLTLEEAIVGYLARTTITDRPDADARAAPHAAQLEWGLSGPNHVVPLLEWLASPAYDPHPLAAGLGRELERSAPRPALEPWLDCLSAAPEGGPPRPLQPTAFATALPAPLAGVFEPFVTRCPAEVGAALSAALDRAWGAPPERRPTETALPGKAAALGGESR